MLSRLLSRSPDLQRLIREGYNVVIVGGYIVIKDVPYVTSGGKVERAWLVDSLKLADDATTVPEDHTMRFTGTNPCDPSGQVLRGLESSDAPQQLVEGLQVQRTFSQKPVNATGKYADYHDKVTHYVSLICPHAALVDPSASAQTFPVLGSDDETSIFNYIDNASSNAGISLASAKLDIAQVAIIGLGGTGAYVLDLLAKTWIREVHLFDDDVLLQHNAFRAPGAASNEDLAAKPKKVAYYAAIYQRMRKSGIVAHPYHMTRDHLSELAGMSFVFLCFDGGANKRAVMDYLVEQQINFIDVGLGLQERDGTIGGIARTSIVTTANPGDATDNNHIPNSEAELPNEYDRNIQVAELNSLNAALAVIRFKKTLGYYQDQEHERRSLYTVGGNHMTNGDPL